MRNPKMTNGCAGFRPMDGDMGFSYRRSPIGNCKDCAYFSSRNCGMDAADSIEPDIEGLF